MSRLERWSRLKRNVQKEEDASPASLAATEPALHNEAEPPQGASELSSAPEEQEPEREPASAPAPGSLDHTLPDPDTLDAGSDFSAFMLPGVSGALRRKALKHLWATGNYNVRDGLDDYDLDYRQQLKPMAAELASKLRRWTHKVEEVVDKPLDDAPPQPQQELAADESTNENVDESSIVLDDQSDFISSSQKNT